MNLIGREIVNDRCPGMAQQYINATGTGQHVGRREIVLVECPVCGASIETFITLWQMGLTPYHFPGVDMVMRKRETA